VRPDARRLPRVFFLLDCGLEDGMNGNRDAVMRAVGMRGFVE
jgi:hypothetical protein